MAQVTCNHLWPVNSLHPRVNHTAAGRLQSFPQSCVSKPLHGQQNMYTVLVLMVSDFTLRDCKNSLRDAFQCIAQPNTTLLDCILYGMQYPCDPGTLPSSAN